MNEQNDSYHWIRFNKETHRLLQVSAREITSKNSKQICAKIQDDLCSEIRLGKTNMHDCTVIHDVVKDDWCLIKKSDKIALRHIGNRLYRIPTGRFDYNEINLRIYPSSSIMDIMVNINVLKQNFRIKKITSIVNADKNLFNLFFCKRGDPDNLMGTVEFDPEMLLNHRVIRMDLSFLNKHADWNDIAVFTRPIFNSYSIEYSQVAIEVNDAFENNRPLQVSIPDNTAHINIHVRRGTACVTSNLTEQQEYLLNGTKSLKFIVCDGIIDNMLGAFEVSCNDLLLNKTVIKPLNFDWPEQPIIVYKNKELTVSHKGE